MNGCLNVERMFGYVSVCAYVVHCVCLSMCLHVRAGLRAAHVHVYAVACVCMCVRAYEYAEYLSECKYARLCVWTCTYLCAYVCVYAGTTFCVDAGLYPTCPQNVSIATTMPSIGAFPNTCISQEVSDNGNAIAFFVVCC
jgi:hypothetical protein